MRSTSLASALLLASTLLCHAQTGERPPSPGRITGIVLNEYGQPVDHAAACTTVSSSSGSTKTDCSVFTDQSGQFEIAHLAMETFFVFATKEEDGYSSWNQGLGQKVVLTAQEPIVNVTIKLAPKAGILIGLVRDSLTGKPVDKIRVVYFSTDAQSSGSAGEYTGEFRINLPTTTDFIVFVTAPGYKSWFYIDPSDQSRPSLHLASGEQKSLDVELVREPKAADKP